MAHDTIRDPESWPAAFTKRLEAGDIDGILALYEPEAKMFSGARRDLQQRAIEVLRRQPDGSWKLVFGDPMGRGGVA